MIQRPLSRHISHTVEGLVVGILRGKMFAEVRAAKVGSALLKEATILLIWEVRPENVCGKDGKK